MMLDCFVRLVAISPQNSFQRPVRSNLYIGIRKTHCQEPRLMLVTSSSITEFKVIENVKRIYRQEINNGKIGIEFFSPPHQLLIKSTTEAITKFMDLLCKLVKRRNVENMDYIPVLPQLKRPVVKQGNIATATSSNISTLQNKVINIGIVPVKALKINLRAQLSANLKRLEMPDNKLESVPLELGDIAVEHINFDNNYLTNDSLGWLQKPTIRKSLHTLILSRNQIKYFPTPVIDFPQLELLNLQDNAIRYLPGTLGQVQRLRILNLSGNRIRFLPASISLLKLLEIDLTYNLLTYNMVSDYIPEKESLRAFMKLGDMAALKLSTDIRRQLTPKDCPTKLLHDVKYLSMCVCDRASVARPNAEYYKAISGTRFAMTCKIHPQSNDFSDIPMRSIYHKGNSEGKIYLQYHFCTYSNGCNNVKFRANVSEYSGYRLKG